PLATGEPPLQQLTAWSTTRERPDLAQVYPGLGGTSGGGVEVIRVDGERGDPGFGAVGDPERGDLRRRSLTFRIGADQLQIVRHAPSAHGEGDQCIRRAGGVLSTRGGAHSGELLDGGARLGQVGPGQDHVVQLGGDGSGCGPLRFRSSSAVSSFELVWRIGTLVYPCSYRATVFERVVGLMQGALGSRARGPAAPDRPPSPARRPRRTPPTLARA